MAKTFQFENPDSTGKKPFCLACAEMLADALDETLSEADQAWFERHLATCEDCSQRMADAQRGAAWLEMLKSPRPEPSAHLMERILAATSDALPSGPEIGDVIQMPARPARILPFRIPLPRFSTPWLEPRVAMTAAMAFFSIALTLNLTGVKLNELKASDLSPTNLKRTYFAANAGVSRYYDNLRVVRVMESKVDDLRDGSLNEDAASPENDRRTPAPTAAPAPAQQPAQAPDQQPDKQDQDKQPEQQGGMTRRDTPLSAPHILLADDKLRHNGNSAGGSEFRKMEGGLA